MKGKKIWKAIAAGAIFSLMIEILFLILGTGNLSGWNWKHILLGACVYSLTTAALVFTGIWEKEKKEWNEAGSGKFGRKKAKFALEHVFLALPLFMLILWHFRSFLDLYRMLFAALLLMMCSLLLNRIRISSSLDRIITVFAYLMLICFIMNSLLWSWSRWTGEAYQQIRTVTRYMLKAGQTLGLLLMIVEAKKSIRRCCVAYTGMFLLWLAYRVTNYQVLLAFFSCACLSNLLGKRETTSKIYLSAYAAYIAFMAVANLTGWADVQYFQRKGGMVSAFGMAHSNSIALLMMVILLFLWYLWFYRSKISTLVSFVLTSAAIWYVTYCRTVVVLLMIFALSWIITGRLSKRTQKKLMYVQIFLPLLAAGISYLLTRFQIPFLQKLDNNFSLRFSIPAEALKEYSITLFGNRFDYNKYIMDNIYLRILVGSGLVAAVVIILLFCWSGYRFYIHESGREAMLLAFFVIYGLMESVPVHIAFSFVPLFASAVERRKDTNGHFEALLSSAVPG